MFIDKHGIYAVICLDYPIASDVLKFRFQSEFSSTDDLRTGDKEVTI